MPKDKAYWKEYNQKRKVYLSQKKKEARKRAKALSTTALFNSDAPLSITCPVEKTNSQQGGKINKITTKWQQYLPILLFAFFALANLLIGMVALRGWTILPRLSRALAIGCLFNGLFGLLVGLYLILTAKKKPKKGGKK